MRKLSTLFKIAALIFIFSNTYANPASQNNIDLAKLIKATSAKGLKPEALKATLNAYTWALKHDKLGPNKDTLTVIDFTLPSYKKRMWIINLKQNKVLMKLYTSQGKGSGAVYATRFSDRAQTDESSVGLYVTSNEYSGKHGLSMRLNGLEPGINDAARRRAIVIHAAWYVTPHFVKQHHYVGRSWGCFAVNPSKRSQLFKYIKNGSAIFVYAEPEKHDPIATNGPFDVA